MEEGEDGSKVRVGDDIKKFKRYRMKLDTNWNWQKKKLGCRIRPENANPSKDALREVFAELAGVDLNEILGEMRNDKKKKEAANKVLIDHEGEKTFKEVLSRSRVLGATKLALEELDKIDEAKMHITQNVMQQFAVLPKSPPRRVMLEIQRERSKPLRLPDQDLQRAANEKLERLRAKQRAARMAAMEQSAKEEQLLIATHEFSKIFMDPASVLPAYKGDLFGSGGNYLEGMLYLSRMADSSLKTQRINVYFDHDQPKTPGTAEEVAVEADKKNKEDVKHADQDDKASLAQDSVNQDTNAKLHCAASLCNWSRNPANAARLASEGAVRAINQLALEPVHSIAMYCAAAYRYMSEHLELATVMIDEIKTISTISEMVSSTTDDFIAYNLAIALVNLTRVNGKEGVVVDAAIVLVLMNLIMLKPELGATCVRGLYNLTCVDATYTSIERVIRALVSLSLSGTSSVKHLCAAALCNLSDLKSVRARMVEEGAINVLTTLSRGAETRTRRVCAVILQNLSAAKSVRIEMASRSSVSVAYALSSDQDPIILRCIGLTLSRLAMEPTNCQKIIHESGVAALGSIAVKYPTIPGISQPVASAFQLLSSNANFRVNIVNEGSVTAIASLLRSSVDMFTLQHSLLALCNLLCESENHLPIIQQGLILTLISMCDHDNDLIKDFCSLAFLNLSCAEDSRKHLVNAGAVVAIINIATQNSAVTKKRCAATLCNLSYYTAGMARMVADGIIPSIVQLVIAKDIFTVHYSCAALCRLCCTVENSTLILESGAVPNLVQGACEGDQTTQQFCGAVLSSLSYYESCRVTLCEMGAITALKGLAELNDETTKQRCLVAFANLSCEVSVQVNMIKEGVVSIIAELANSLKEVTYICCAKAICNLACNPDTKLSVATDGGVHALLMISMVQSVDPLTKLLCVIGLNNLLDASTIDFMLDEGLIGSIANLSKVGGAHISMLSAKIFNHLTRFDVAREKMVERKAVLMTLFNLLCESGTAETQVIAIRTTCNLVLDPHVRGPAIFAGAFGPLEKGVEMEDRYTVMQCLVSLFWACSEPKFMELMAKGTLPSTLLNFASSLPESDTSDEEYGISLKIIAMLSWEERSRLFMQKKELIEQIFLLIEENLKTHSVRWLAYSLRFLVLGYTNMMELVRLDILPMMLKLSDALPGDSPEAVSTVKSLTHALLTLASDPACIAEVASGGALVIMKRAAQICLDDDEVMYETASLMYLFASTSAASRLCSANAEGAFILQKLGARSNCVELMAAIVGLYIMDSKARGPFSNEAIAHIITKILDKPVSDSVAVNIILCIYGFSKLSACRDFLMTSPIHFDKMINKLALIDNPNVRANCSRAYKNLNSEVNEAIEEGAVASLIAISLEGKMKNQSSDEFLPPDVHPQKHRQIPPPACASDISETPTEAQWFEKVKVTNGGAAGKGPEPPEPPAMTIDGSSEYPNMAEELDAGEIEGKTKMSFAKMQVPQVVRDAHLLSDTDFMLNADRESDENSAADAAPVDAAAEVAEALTAQLEAQQTAKGSVVSGSTGAAPMLDARRGRATSQKRLSRNNSSRNSKQSSPGESPRLDISAPSPDTRKVKRTPAGQLRPIAVSASQNSLSGVKEPTMQEQAQKLGLFT
ncbi:armadillo-type protein [Ochromonadaceae sp. CCMP2298]|nr:armadillo-type protein [Ochromonadaceae sp. CCMP2298]|mmetsp:Transcript_4361/g.9800  ORF Transcript_4361/g.9800 Transcript_4361/m.9800 type:complete len:1631 (+) Transcript_4361:112-5004(+)